MSRIRANKITNQAANGAPVCEQGLIVTGILTATGNISVGGTLTYEDVTNVDSVGVITARSTIDAQGDVSIVDKIIHSGDTNTAIRFPAGDTISFETAGTERLRIDSSGLIGIGLSAYSNTSASEYDGDANNLVVGTGSGNEGITILSGQNVSNYGSIFFADGTGATNSKRGQLRYEQNNEVMSFYTAGTEKVRINAAGNVGIGTDNPSQLLHLAADSAHKILLKRGGAAPSEVTFGNESNYAIISNNTNGIELRTGSTPSIAMHIDQTGKVGINTDIPSRLLEINTTGTSTEGIVVRSHDNTYPKIQFGANRTSADAFLGMITASWDGTQVADILFETGSDTTNKDDGIISFRTSSASGNREERLRIGSSGQFGIAGANYGTAGQVLTSGGSSAAPSWSGGSTRVLECFNVPCSGESVVTSHGTRTTTNVTGVQNLTTSYVTLSGSQITYRPPTGTHTVVYKFLFQATRADADTIAHFRFYVGSDEIQYARHTRRGEDFQGRVVFEWPIRIDSGSANNYNHGRLQSWNSDLVLKMEGRDYSGTYDMKIHVTDNWDGSGTDMFSMPTISVTALGT